MRNMTLLVCRSLLAIAAMVLSGCLTHHYGDARLRERTDAFSITPDRFYLKPIPLDRMATHTLHVRELPFPIYPTHLSVAITPVVAEMKGGFPWEELKLRIEFRSTSGETFFSKEISLVDALRGHSPETYHQLELKFREPEPQSWRAPKNMPHHTSYDVIVTVLQPSKNKNHSATLYADTYVK